MAKSHLTSEATVDRRGARVAGALCARRAVPCCTVPCCGALWRPCRRACVVRRFALDVAATLCAPVAYGAGRADGPV